MKKVLFVLLCAALSAVAFGQNEVEGVWLGYITQDPGGLADKYHFQVNLDLKGDNLEGTSTIAMLDDESIFGIMTLKGEANNVSVSFNEQEIIKQNMYSFAYWCIKDIELQLVKRNGKEVLVGSWTSNQCPGTGEIVLERLPML